MNDPSSEASEYEVVGTRQRANHVTLIAEALTVD